MAMVKLDGNGKMVVMVKIMVMLKQTMVMVKC